ncbi:ThiF family adenylyltransferase [Deinococcus sp. MIMF12]|uniref:ThiF family adenylyltransferase n=1 Tax=Deinococcus rhizophilus TaxID=3049544 RepID=A0ABT7JI03_9DEIO|nr:ThiF family adenylyltransferase [Deinococcus rhizophilus]MDL2344685.1 ThiF family adenylyltransferase [Deinococcus rhizophilus]
MPDLDYSVALTAQMKDELEAFLLRADEQEDLIFGLYVPSQGAGRFTALLSEIIFPVEGDRQVHGNVSFNPAYLERVYAEALSSGKGVVFLHSHLGPGWQGVSDDDVVADTRVACSAVPVTGLPLISMTLGTDGTWSARAWTNGNGVPQGQWCTHVRTVGRHLKVDYADHLRSAPQATRRQRRTVAVWGERHQASTARLTVGIVGLGSVGSQVCEQLARSGFTRLILIDHDRVEEHNLDRLAGAYPENVGEWKVDVAGRNAVRGSTAGTISVRRVPHSLASQEGYRAALDCDVLISCVDRPQPRRLLNHIAYAHLIPVIDGGIRVRHKNGALNAVNWQVQTVGPERPCLACLQAYDPALAELDARGLLDDPTYIEGLPQDDILKASENVYTFSSAVASLEVMQLVTLATGLQDFGVQRFDFHAGITEAHLDEQQPLNCSCKTLITATGDTRENWLAQDLAGREVTSLG